MLTEGDLVGPEGPGPAIRVTFARFGREVRYSHTPGVVDDDGQFRPIQHLHDRNVRSYILLLQYATIAVAATKKLDPEAVAAQSYGLKRSLRKAMEESEKAPQPRERDEPKKKQKAQPITKPSLGVSIGEMLKAKQEKGR